MEGEPGITIERFFDAPREMVWRSWTEPEMVKRWWGPEGFTAPSIKIDLRVGGKYIFCMHGPEGSEFDKDLYSAGVYKEIVPMERLVVSDYFSDAEGNWVDPEVYGMDTDMPAEMDVTVMFDEAEGGKTKLTIEYPRPESGEIFQAMLKSGMTEGWNSSLDKLAHSLQRP
jgi:uncharacterized protein YndB with AHSA1/START domain